MKKFQKLPTPKELKQKYPLTTAQKKFITESRETVQNILDGKDERLLLIVGPCSIHDANAAKQFAMNLKAIAKETHDAFFILMRVYYEKPRSILGWKGFINDPYLDDSCNITEGLDKTRALLSQLTDLEIPIASEILEPTSAIFFEDLLSWGCIGARTASSQIHRQIASALDFPVAFKNTTDGNIQTAVNGVVAASKPHTFLAIDEEGVLSALETQGNGHGHVVLRGGEEKPNYDPYSITLALKTLNNAHLPSRLIIDCSHDNSGRMHEQQSIVFQSAISQKVEGNSAIRGTILESHLFAGNQEHVNATALKYGISITDACLDWAATEHLIRWGYSKLLRNQTTAPLCFQEPSLSR